MSLFGKKYNPIFYLLILVLVSCYRGGNESETLDFKREKKHSSVDFDLQKIKERGSLIAVVDNSSTGYFIYKGRPMGYEYELLKLLAEHLQVRLETKLTRSIDEAFDMLNKGEGDVIAYSLTITKKRKEYVAFADNHFTSRQMLIQNKPSSWKSMTVEQIEKSLIRNQVDLIGQEVNVRKSSSFIDRLNNLSHEVGGDILVIEEPDSIETEELIERVAKGQIKYTIADEMVAIVNASYYPDIDVKTPISFPQRIAWAVRKNAPVLLNAINEWQKKIKREPTFNIIYNRYFKSPRSSKLRADSEFSSISGGNISPYDDLIKEIAEPLDWDWKLLVAQMYRESRFDPKAKSWAGAYGLMQLVPETGRRFGAQKLYDPEQNIMAAGAFLKHLDGLWAKTVDDKKERQKFVLASYNVGLGHVVDARNLARKYNHNPTIWDDNVEKFLQLKSKREYFTDPIVKLGYCRGDEPVNYVEDILDFFELYKQLITS